MKNTVIEVPVEGIRAAQFCVCKDDYRRNITGFLLGKKGEIVSTNGHLLYEAIGDFELKKPVLIRMESLTPKNARDCSFHFLGDGLGYLKFTVGKSYKSKTKHIMLEYEKDPEYVDYKKAVEPSGKYKRTGLSLNTAYFSLIKNIFPESQAGLNIEFNSESFVTIKPLNYNALREEKMIIMLLKSDCFSVDKV